LLAKTCLCALDGDTPFEFLVKCFPNDAHATASNLTQDSETMNQNLSGLKRTSLEPGGFVYPVPISHMGVRNPDIT
jgi:hypothetical protein